MNSETVDAGGAPLVVAAPVAAPLVDPSSPAAPGAPLPPSDPNAPAVVARAPIVHERPSLLLFWIITVVSTVADLASKEWATKRLSGFDPTTNRPKELSVIDGLLEFQYAQNPGGAFSMLRNLPEIARRPFFLVVSTIASVFIASIYPRIDRRQWAMKIGLPLALGGALGNLVDRMRHGMVVDFIHAYWKRHNWPTFNVADIWIVVGVLLMAIDVVASRKLRSDLLKAHEEEFAAARAAEGANPP